MRRKRAANDSVASLMHLPPADPIVVSDADPPTTCGKKGDDGDAANKGEPARDPADAPTWVGVDGDPTVGYWTGAPNIGKSPDPVGAAVAGDGVVRMPNAPAPNEECAAPATEPARANVGDDAAAPTAVCQGEKTAGGCLRRRLHDGAG